MPAPLRSLPPLHKKRKISTTLSNSVQRFEDQLIEAVSSNSSLNLLEDLLQLAFSAEDAQDTSKSIYALYRVFVVIITTGKLGLDGDEAAKVVKAWIWDRLKSYIDFLCSLLKDNEKFLRESALQILFSLLRHLSTSYTKSTATTSNPQPQFHVSHFRKIVSGLLICPLSKRSSSTSVDDGKLDIHVRDLFLQTWLTVHDDIRWFFLRESTYYLTLNHVTEHPSIPDNLLSIIERLNTFPTDQSELNAWWVTELGARPPKPKHTKNKAQTVDADSDSSDGEEAEDDWRKFFDEDVTLKDDSKTKTPSTRLNKLTIHQSLHSLASHRAVFSRAWLTLLSQIRQDSGSGKALAMRALSVMHRGVMPHLTRPVLIMDWVSASVDYGGTVGLIALNALFVLMKEYNLDYPSFYTRLYAFLDRDLLHLKHRARFFRLTELFLSSTHLPATLLASFIKRLSRLSLTAPPAAIIMIIPFTYNVLKRHPALMGMIHRADSDDSNKDPFQATERNPNITNALESSLWELFSHKTHYHSAVSTLVSIFEEAFTKPGYSMEDFLDHTYGTLLESELKRKIKKEPAIGMEEEMEVLNEMWTVPR